MLTHLKRLIPPPFRRSVRLRRILERERCIVRGPFRGMPYLDRAVGSMFWPKILGTYELEIEDVVLDVIARSPRRIVVVGAAEGYYAVGLAWRLPETSVAAFEADEEGRRLLQELAAANGVDSRVDVRGLCSIRELRDAVTDPQSTFVLVDAEGAELYLLDPEFVPSLTDCEILVETHDFLLPGVTAEVIARFAGTHQVSEQRQRPRAPRDVHGIEIPKALEGSLAVFLAERRPAANQWLWLRPKGCA